MGDEVNGSSDGSKATSNSGGGAVKGVTETASAWLLCRARMGKGEGRASTRSPLRYRKGSGQCHFDHHGSSGAVPLTSKLGTEGKPRKGPSELFEPMAVMCALSLVPLFRLEARHTRVELILQMKRY